MVGTLAQEIAKKNAVEAVGVELTTKDRVICDIVQDAITEAVEDIEIPAGDEFDLEAAVQALDEKAAPVVADSIVGVDSEAEDVLVTIPISALPFQAPLADVDEKADPVVADSVYGIDSEDEDAIVSIPISALPFQAPLAGVDEKADPIATDSVYGIDSEDEDAIVSIPISALPFQSTLITGTATTDAQGEIEILGMNANGSILVGLFGAGQPSAAAIGNVTAGVDKVTFTNIVTTNPDAGLKVSYIVLSLGTPA
jgi:hypothetical protein